MPGKDLEELPGPFDGSLCLWRQEFDDFHRSSVVGGLIRELKNENSEQARSIFVTAVSDFFLENPLDNPPDIVTIIPDSRPRSYPTVAAITSCFCERLGWPFLDDLIIPAKIGKPQKNRSWTERKGDRTLRYRLTSPESVSGKHVLIFDDIYATGQSMNEAAELMRAAGAKYVSVLALVHLLPRE
ncbi:MAG: phosphoribosyltransferase family protein [Candidatus Zixiibacteriota bacterium]